MKNLVFFVFFLIQLLSISAQFFAAPEYNVTLNVCALIEEGNPDLLVSLRKLSAAIDVGITHAHNGILPAGIHFKLYSKGAGKRCTSRNNAFKGIMEWMRANVTCNVFLGPGK